MREPGCRSLIEGSLFCREIQEEGMTLKVLDIFRVWSLQEG